MRESQDRNNRARAEQDREQQPSYRGQRHGWRVGRAVGEITNVLAVLQVPARRAGQQIPQNSEQATRTAI